MYSDVINVVVARPIGTLHNQPVHQTAYAALRLLVTGGVRQRHILENRKL